MPAEIEKSSISRRRFLRTTGVATAATTTLGGCLGGESGDAGDANGTTTGSNGNELADKITLYTGGGSWGRKLKESMLTPFEKETGVTINHQTHGGAGSLLAKIKAGQADVDMMQMTDPILYQGVKDGIWGALRRENIPNLDRLVTHKPDEVPFDPGEEIHHVPNTYGAYGVVYNTEQITEEPTEWDDLYTSELEGKLGLSQFTTSVVGTAALDLGFNVNEFASDESKVDEVFERVKKQNEYVYQWWDSGTTAQELFTNESAIAGNFWVGRTRVLNNENGVPVKYTLPEDGAIGYVSPWALNDELSDPKRYTCEQLLNYILANEPSKRLAEKINYAQANEITDAPESYQSIPDRQNPERISLWDPEVYNKHSNEWSQRFQEIARD